MLNSGKQESKTSVLFTKQSWGSARELSSSSKGQHVLVISSQLHSISLLPGSKFQLTCKQIFWADKKTTVMLAWGITKAYLIPQTSTFSSKITILWISIMSCFLKEKSHLLDAFSEGILPNTRYLTSDSLQPLRYWCTINSLYSLAMCAFPFPQAVAP